MSHGTATHGWSIGRAAQQTQPARGDDAGPGAQADAAPDAHVAEAGGVKTSAAVRKTFWGCEWHSRNRRDGEECSLMWEQGKPLIFETRAEARAFIKHKWGYIAERPDLRAEPHGWRMPRAVRVVVSVAAEGLL